MTKFYCNLFIVLILNFICLGNAFGADLPNGDYIYADGESIVGSLFETAATDGINNDYDLVSSLDAGTDNIAFRSTSFTQRTLTVRDGAIVVLKANQILFSYVEIVIEEGGTLTIDGDLNISDQSDMQIDGTLIITGDLSISDTAGSGGDANQNIGGPEVDNEFNFGCLCFIEVNDPGLQLRGSGTIDLGGDFNSGTVTADQVDEIFNFDCTKLNSNSSPELACTDISLPVSLTYFESFIENNTVALEWETASEQNASHFDIQRSIDRKNWKTLGTVQAAGNSNAAILYEFIDEAPIAKAFYRLHQVDFDGANEYFGPLYVKLDGVEENFKVVIMPNHAQKGEKIQLQAIGVQEGGDLSIKVFNAHGHLVYEDKQEQISSSSLLMPLEISDRLGTGMYYVVVQSGKEVVKEKLLMK
ncbi:T9SS type A sorting domain-containing protein [Flammeovirga kamogawensis]|uniref:T9SS type A sorting domain-containing protein n=1 Tax=Flammeovirga kamogawensis TaxID=373891 RepID=A0ABX8GSV9_9BACT|nr:T9SS type A sorting domain-containing protein [Flammeovirga kamogawensis]MBB6462973.1 hypothetical protein [Flammeovirga kamogawensis]QWG06498.1 T9SS type A sorting domain-containing protein [Flammeovirga kamogawensis]TRX68326.1 T9SS type A sorting domain-containing protein [Flammeovirga kamogawensis]